MKRSTVFMIIAALTITGLSACSKKAADPNPIVPGSYVPDETSETASVQISESTDDNSVRTVKVTIPEELQQEAEDYAAYIQMQEDKISILTRSLASKDTFEEYKATAELIIQTAQDAIDYPVPEDNKELKEITTSAFEEIISTIEDSLSKAEESFGKGEN